MEFHLVAAELYHSLAGWCPDSGYVLTAKPLPVSPVPFQTIAIGEEEPGEGGSGVSWHE